MRDKNIKMMKETSKMLAPVGADAMVAGKDVKIEVKAIFEGTSKRPSKFEVLY